jgi:dihydrofolate reductase
VTYRGMDSIMRRIVVLEHITLDGVIQAGGGPEEDTSGGFAYGGWAAPYDDDILGAALQKQMNMPFDLLLGRKTFDIWAAFWPQHADVWPGVNTATKYVACRRSPNRTFCIEHSAGWPRLLTSC